MNNRRFLSLHPAADNRVLLTGDELYHLKTVNRAKKGDELEVIDGKGSLYYGNIRDIGNHEAVVEILKRESRDKPPVRIAAAPSLTKKKAMNLMMEKLSEMGVDEIRPVIMTRTDEKYAPAMLQKWRRIALQSLKVNKKLWPTDIFPPVRLEELTEDVKTVGTKILLHATGERVLPTDIRYPAICLIGPPGDFTPEEKDRLLAQGFIPVKINDGILKTETAAISIAAILKFGGRPNGEG
jgi:16S rRNA (uracil1498-N3)-methyltransferase